MYRVFWGQQFHRLFAEYYDQADAGVRDSILQAIETLDDALAADPLGIGESRASQHVRIVLEHPFAVTYRVDANRRLVHVTAVGFFRPRR